MSSGTIVEGSLPSMHIADTDLELHTDLAYELGVSTVKYSSYCRVNKPQII